MNQIIAYLKSFDFIKDCLLLIVGYLAGIFVKLVKKRMARYEIKKNQIIYKKENIISLDHADPYYKDENIKITNSKELFQISFPRKIFEEILSICDGFSEESEPQKNVYFGENADFLIQSLSEILEKDLSEVRDLLERHKQIIAKDMYERIKQGQTLFNGKMFGIKKITSTRSGKNEEAVLKLTAFETDYFTHRVMADIYQELKNEEHPISKVNDIHGINKYFPFVTAFGMDTILYLEDERDKNKIVLTMRSKHLYNMKKDTWHLSMNEALTFTDVDYNNNISLKQCVERGLREELHIDLKDRDEISSYYFGDLFFCQDVFEIGISNLTKVRQYSYEDVELNFNVAKDSKLESVNITSISSSRRQNKKFLKKSSITPACRYCLFMWIARNYLE